MASQLLGQSAAADLLGRTLPGGWTVVEKIVPAPGSSGGNFSINYWVEDGDGRRGFCKVLNFHWLLNSAGDGEDPLDQLKRATTLFQFERDLARACVRLSKVVTALDDGSFVLDGYAVGQVSYIIFEVADRDIRTLLNETDRLDLKVRLRALHHLAAGVQQLHMRNVAHQDIKPSNTLVFPVDSAGRRVTKVGDLGRATVLDAPEMEHDLYWIAGDPKYGPPEGLYRAVTDGFGPRRLSCDLYQLGSMICFIFTGLQMTALLFRQLHPQHNWLNWTGTYSEVLPYVRDAFGQAVEQVADDAPSEIRARVKDLVRQLCDPEPLKRGHLRTRRYGGSQFALNRIVTDLDRLALAAAGLKVGESGDSPNR